MVQYDMSADCDGEGTRGALPCLVPELQRVVKRVTPGPSMIRHQIVKTRDRVGTRSTPSLRPFCLLSASNGRSRYLFECWTKISDPWGVMSKSGIVVGSGFHRRSPLPRTTRGDTWLMVALWGRMNLWEGCLVVDMLREREKKKQVDVGNRMPMALGIRQDVFHKRRCIFLEWLVFSDPKSKSVGKYNGHVKNLHPSHQGSSSTSCDHF